MDFIICEPDLRSGFCINSSDCSARILFGVLKISPFVVRAKFPFDKTIICIVSSVWLMRVVRIRSMRVVL